MKKNMLTVIILALCLVNTILSALIVFVVVPTSQRTDKLITQVASVINLELEGEGASKVDIASIEAYKVEEKKTMNLKMSENGKEHYAVMDYVSLSINMESEDYARLQPLLATQNSAIMDIVDSVMSRYTYEEAINNREQMKEEILEELKRHFGSLDFVIGVTLGNLLFS